MNSIIIYIHRISFLNNWVVPLSKHLNYHINVFHIASLNKEELLHSKKLSNNLCITDISYLSHKEVLSLIHQINPSFYLSLGFRSPMELLLQRIFFKLKIKSIYLEHGFYSEDTIQLNILNSIVFVLKYTLNKNIYFLKKICEYLWVSKNPVKESRLFLKAILFGQYYNLKFDKAYFFAEYGFNKLNKFFKYSSEEIVFCGYPLFDTTNTLNKIKNKIIDKKREVLYVHQPFIQDKLVTISYNEELQFLSNLVEIFKIKGYRFTILLHPRSDITYYQKLYRSLNVNIIQSPNDFSVFIDKEIVIGHYSTALLFAIYFNIKTVIFNYPKLKVDMKPFVNIGHYIADLEELGESLEKDVFRSPNRNDFIRYAGNSYTYENIGRLLNNESKIIIRHIN